MGSTVFVVMGFAALSVDIALITLSELQAQATADAASHAALVAYRQAATASGGESLGLNAASYLVNRAEVGLGKPSLDAIQFGLFDHQSQVFQFPSPTENVNAVRVAVSRSGGNAVDLLLAPLLGVNTHSVEASSTTSQQQRAIMLVQDASLSMMGSSPSAAINVARQANTVFFDYLVQFPQDGDMLGVAQYGKFAALALEVGGGVTTAYPAYHTMPWAQLREIKFNEGYLRSRIDGICDTLGRGYCPAGDNHPWNDETTIGGTTYTGLTIGTNPGIAMEQAIGQLRDRTDRTYFRGMVVFSDGMTTGDSGVKGLSGPQRAANAATTAWDVYDINIWTIMYYNKKSNQGHMDSLVRGSGFAQNSPSLATLPAMYEEVVRSIPTVLVY